MSNGAFAQSGHGTYRDSVNRPGEGRQMSVFFDLNALDRNRQVARERQEQLRRSGIDWKACKVGKKAEKRKGATSYIFMFNCFINIRLAFSFAFLPYYPKIKRQLFSISTLLKSLLEKS